MKKPQLEDLDALDHPPGHPVRVVREIYERALAEAEENLVAMKVIPRLHQCKGWDCSCCHEFDLGDD